MRAQSRLSRLNPRLAQSVAIDLTFADIAHSNVVVCIIQVRAGPAPSLRSLAAAAGARVISDATLAPFANDEAGPVRPVLKRAEQPVPVAKNAAQACDRARRPEWRRAASTDGKPEPRFSGLRSGFRTGRTGAALCVTT